MVKPVRWLRKFFKSSKSPLKRKSNAIENDRHQAIETKLPNEKQISVNLSAEEQVAKQLMQAVEATPDQDQVMQVIPEVRKANIAATVESVVPHTLPPPPDICPNSTQSPSRGKEDVERKAAMRIQTTFRRFLAYRAFRALKGLVRLQALVRGHRVRRQAAVALRCILAVVKVQAHARAYLVRTRKEGQEAQKTGHGRPQAIYNLTNELNPSVPTHSFSSFQVGRHDSGWYWLEHWTAARPWVLEFASKQNNSSSQEFKRFRQNGDVVSMDIRIYPKYQSIISLHEETPSPNPQIPSLMTPNGPSEYVNHSYLPPEESPSRFPLAGEVTLLPDCQGSPPLDRLSSEGSVSVCDKIENGTNSRKSGASEKETDSVSSKSTPGLSNSSKSSEGHESPILEKVEQTPNQTEESPTMVPSYMATTESSKAKVRSNSTPRNRPRLAEKSPKIVKHRLSLPGSNRKASPETTHSQRWNSSTLRLDK